jgi:hypothetical protein
MVLPVISRFPIPPIALQSCIRIFKGIVIFPLGSLALEGDVGGAVNPGAPKEQENYNQRLQERPSTHFAGKWLWQDCRGARTGRGRSDFCLTETRNLETESNRDSR